MKSALVLLAAVTVFTTLFLESSSTPFFGSIGENLGNFLEEEGKGLDKTLVGIKTIVDDVDKKVKHVVAGVVETVDAAILSAKDKAAEDKKTVKENVGEGIQSAKDKAAEDKKPVKENRGEGIQSVKDKTAEDKKTVKENVGEVIQSAKDKAAEDKKTCKENRGEGIQSAKDKTAEDKKTVDENVGEGIQSAKDKKVKDIQIVIDLLVKFVNRKIKTCEETQSEVTAVIFENLAADCEGKKDVTDLKVWWNNMKVIIAEIHNEVKDIFKTGSWENCDQVVYRINKACDDTKAKLDDSKAILPGDIYEILEQRMGMILNCATDIVMGLEYVKLHPNEAKDLEKKFVDEKMKKCDETRAKLAKAMAAEEDLKQLQDWFKDLQVKIAGLHKNVKYTVDTGSWDSCDDIIDDIKTTCEKTKAKMTDFDKTLSDDMKEILKPNMVIIFDCAYDIVSSLECLKALENYA